MAIYNLNSVTVFFVVLLPWHACIIYPMYPVNLWSMCRKLVKTFEESQSVSLRFNTDPDSNWKDHHMAFFCLLHSSLEYYMVRLIQMLQHMLLSIIIIILMTRMSLQLLPWPIFHPDVIYYPDTTSTYLHLLCGWMYISVHMQLWTTLGVEEVPTHSLLLTGRVQ